MDWKAAVAARIKEAMKSWEDAHPGEALTFERFSELTEKKLSPSRLSNYANAIRLPKPGEANVMAGILGCDAAWLMCLQQEFNKQELDLVKNFRRLPEKDRNSYSRRIAVLSLAYMEPAPDEPQRAPAGHKLKASSKH